MLTLQNQVFFSHFSFSKSLFTYTKSELSDEMYIDDNDKIITKCEGGVYHDSLE